MDKGREFDLEELALSIKNAKTPGERDHYKRIMYLILNQSDDVRYWREELIKAVRTEDNRRLQYVIAKIQYIRQNETAGHSWGSQKGERIVN